MKHTDRQEPEQEPERNITTEQTPARRNPRLVIGDLDFFDMLMEQDEEG